MLKMTSKKLANYVIEENAPFDYEWLKYVYRSEGAAFYMCLKYLFMPCICCFMVRVVFYMAILLKAVKGAKYLIF